MLSSIGSGYGSPTASARRRGLGLPGRCRGKAAGFGSCSVLDIDVASADATPFRLPIARYLEEALQALAGQNPAIGRPHGCAPQAPFI